MKSIRVTFFKHVDQTVGNYFQIVFWLSELKIGRNYGRTLVNKRVFNHWVKQSWRVSSCKTVLELPFSYYSLFEKHEQT